ncbi:MAG: magnesium transporter, partial [Chloroflexi bacterium]|nr:magnesium transporter [Chloroflexota bacterium]
MTFLSNLIGQPVVDVAGDRLGTLSDFVVTLGDVFPRVSGLAVTTTRGRSLTSTGEVVVLAASQLERLDGRPVGLKALSSALERYEPVHGDVWLTRDVLDKQIVDPQGRRVVKVNDVQLTQIEGVTRLVGVDISGRAFLRRLGAERTADFLGNLLPFRLPERLIAWSYVETIDSDAQLPQLRLTVAHTQLAELHPADLADLLEQMPVAERTAVLTGLDLETAAEALEEVEPELQAAIVQSLDTERASDLLELMPPDNAADILAELTEEQAEALLARMEPAEAEEVRELLTYDERTAGGLMTTEVLRLGEELTAEEAIVRLRTEALETEAIWYLYVVDGDGRLGGVVSFRRLITASPSHRLSELMDSDVITVQTDTDQEEVARIISKYDLLAVPVLDEHAVLRGIVTVDDVIDVIEEERGEDLSRVIGADADELSEPTTILEAARGRLTWIGFALVASLFSGLLLRLYAESLVSAFALFYFVPLLLHLGTTIGGQSLAVVGHRLVGDPVPAHELVRRELVIGLLVGVLA